MSSPAKTASNSGDNGNGCGHCESGCHSGRSNCGGGGDVGGGGGAGGERKWWFMCVMVVSPA